MARCLKYSVACGDPRWPALPHELTALENNFRTCGWCRDVTFDLLSQATKGADDFAASFHSLFFRSQRTNEFRQLTSSISQNWRTTRTFECCILSCHLVNIICAIWVAQQSEIISDLKARLSSTHDLSYSWYEGLTAVFCLSHMSRSSSHKTQKMLRILLFLHASWTSLGCRA